MWIVSRSEWTEHSEVGDPERMTLWADAREAWITEASRDYTIPGFDVFDDCGAFVLDQADREYRAGVRW